MNRNRLIQFLAVAVFLLAVTGAGWLAVPIDQSRQALGLGFQTTAGRAIDPSITIPTAALGSFRGVAVVTLWIRAIRLQDEGKFFEANQLARMITTLQPRFPRVWQYQAWNMAYNISVATHTREERWGWVNKGIVLLRDKGIVYNPTAVTLYRELGWFFFHKIGQFMDDAHWYYRDQLAMQWHELLGAAPSGAMAEEVIDRFRVIVEAPETLSQLMDQEPGVKALVAALMRLDYDFDESLLRKIGYVQMLSAAQVLRLVQSEQMTDDGERKLNPRLVSVMTNPEWAGSIPPFLACLRKKVLRSDYHMDPVFMLELMERYGPLDWRHPMSHACYWSEMGAKMTTTQQDAKQRGSMSSMTQVELLSTSRQAIHTMQALTRYGRISFDPITMRFDFLHEPRFASAYNEAWELHRERAESGLLGDISEEAFDRGHENFLLEVIRYCYLYGDLGQAAHYYKRARDLYGQKKKNLSSGRYRRPLAEVVLDELRQNSGMVTDIDQIVSMMLHRAINEGLAHNRMDAFNRFAELARAAQDRYQQDKRVGLMTPRGRLRLLPFDQKLELVYLSYMQSSRISLLKRSRVWANTPAKLQQRVYDRLSPHLYSQATHAGFVPVKMFPKPSGTPGLRRAAQPREPEAVERMPVKIERQ